MANFRQQFPEVVAATSTAGGPARTATTGQPGVAGPDRYAPPRYKSFGQRLTLPRSQSLSQDMFRDQDPTPRASNEPWRFTPTLLDPASFTFNFANYNYYTATTPGGTNTLYHPQAGDLHTPTLGLGMGTPLSMATSGAAMQPGTTSMDMSFNNGFPLPQFPNQFNPFVPTTEPQPSLAPSHFLSQNSGFEAMDQDTSQADSDHDQGDDQLSTIETAFQPQSIPGFQTGSSDANRTALPPAFAEKFRFHAVLHAPTAMIRHPDEIPVTYLNKGQSYTITITDTNQAGQPVAPGTRFRTYVRVSFEEEQQRQKPNVYWGLWKEGRGTSEAHQRGGKLQAVEYVETSPSQVGDDKKTRVELESSSFDGFAVVWTPPASDSAPECTITVRFNFLSTDFSHSKGVKGIPVRLCAKTQQLPPSQDLAAASSSNSSQENSAYEAEISYCMVKLFRDHGAERKLSNDVAHVRKMIDKLKQQIAQAEAGMKDGSKRKRSAASQALKGGPDLQRPGKVPKHKRSWSMSSVSSATDSGQQSQGQQGQQQQRMSSLEEDLHAKLQSLQDMFTSTRSVSVFSLRGDALDDPDLHPVTLPGTTSDAHIDFRDNSDWRSHRSSIAADSSLLSLSPSSASINYPQQTQEGNFDPDQQTTRVPRINSKGTSIRGWIDALGVDPSYRPPPRQNPKPVACFYVARRSDRHEASGEKMVYRAVYLFKRTVSELVERLAGKFGGFDARLVHRVVREIEGKGLEVIVDDDVVGEMNEGMDFVMDVRQVPTNNGVNGIHGNGNGVKRENSESEWGDEMVLDMDADGEADPLSDDGSSPGGEVRGVRYEIRLRW